MNEIKGLSAGGRAAGLSVRDDVGIIAARGITLANLPGSLVNIKFLFADEYGPNATTSAEFDQLITDTGLSKELIAKLLKTLAKNWAGITSLYFTI